MISVDLLCPFIHRCLLCAGDSHCRQLAAFAPHIPAAPHASVHATGARKCKCAVPVGFRIPFRLDLILRQEQDGQANTISHL